MVWSVVALRATGKTQDKVANMNAIMTVPMNFFLRIFQSISYLTTAQKRMNQLGCGLPAFVLVGVIAVFLLGLC